MTTQTFKEFEHQAWQKAVAQYDVSFSRLTQQMIPAILKALNIRKGMSFLDVACGPGYLAAAAHKKGANASGVDFSSAMIARAQELHPHIAFEEGDAEDLKKYPDACFDTLAMNFGILHLEKPEAALKAAFRVLKKGGKVAFTCWCTPQESLAFSFILKAVEMFGNPKVKLPPAPPLFYFCDHDNCKKALQKAGFTSPEIQVVKQEWELHSPDELFEAFLKGTARTAGLLKGQTAEQLSAIRRDVHQSVSDYLKVKNSIPMPALVAWATKS